MTTDSELLRAFVLAEANARLSDGEPSGDPHYESLKKRLIGNIITEDEARKEILDFYVARRGQIN